MGRKGAFLITVTMMGGATFLIGLLPTYAQAGALGPILLIFLRILQGIALGGEYGGAAIYVAEHAPNNKRGASTGWIQSSASFGLLAALLVIVATRTSIGEDAFGSWGWRIPFLASSVLLAISVWMRAKLAESPHFAKLREEGEVTKAPLRESFGNRESLKRVMEKQVAKRTISAIVLAAATVSFQAPASAQSFTKTEAILGGPSALEALLAQQKAATPATRPTFQAVLQPASYSNPRPTIIPAVLSDTRPAVSPGVFNGRPDVFGSVALRVGHTPLDAKWHRVEHSDIGGSAAAYAASLRGEASVERLEAVNWYVNKRVHFVDDQVRWGRADVWSTANDTLNAGKGDCEDFAIAKLAMLRRAGIADKDLYLVVLRDLVRRADHAVLVVRAGGHMSPAWKR